MSKLRRFIIVMAFVASIFAILRPAFNQLSGVDIPIEIPLYAMLSTDAGFVILYLFENKSGGRRNGDR